MIDRSPDGSALSAHIRSVGTSAAIGAGLLLYFGFAHLAEPVGNDLFDWSAWVFLHTLRIGGVALALAAVWLWTGNVHGLVYDAVVALPIGALLILSGVGMLLGGGNMIQTVINGLCGAMFISSGLYTARLYTEARSNRDAMETESVFLPRAREARLATSPKELNQRYEFDAAPIGEEAGPSARAEEPPPEGYLAQFARKKTQRNDE